MIFIFLIQMTTLNFWMNFIKEVIPVNGVVVSANSFFPKVQDRNITLKELIRHHNLWRELFIKGQ